MTHPLAAWLATATVAEVDSRAAAIVDAVQSLAWWCFALQLLSTPGATPADSDRQAERAFPRFRMANT